MRKLSDKVAWLLGLCPLAALALGAFARGDIIYYGTGSGLIQQYNVDTGQTSTLITGTGNGAGGNGIFFPTALTVGPDGNIYVGNGEDSGYIVKVTPAGAPTKVVSTDAITDGLTFDVNGNLYAAQTNLGSVLQIHLDGSERTYATGLQHPGAMSSDPSGNLYVVTGQTQYGEQVISVAPDGQQSVFTTDVDGIYWANDGHVYIGTWGGTITLTTPSGTTTTLATGLSDPDPLALTAAGDLYFWDARDEMVGELAPDGSVVSVTTTPNAYSVAVAVPEPESLLAVCLPVVAVNIRDRRRRARPSLTVRTDIPF